MTKTNFIALARDKKELSSLMETHGVNEAQAKVIFSMKALKPVVHKINEELHLQVGTEVIKVTSLDEAVILSRVSVESLEENQVTVHNPTNESIEVALGGLLDLALQSNKIPKSLKAVANLLKASGTLSALGIVTENSVDCFYNGKKFKLVSEGGLPTLQYTPHNTYYVPAKLTEQCSVDTHDNIIKVLKEANYESSSNRTNMSDLDYGVFASNIVESLTPDSNLAIVVGKAMASGMNETHAFLSYKHPYINSQFVKAVDLGAPNIQLGLTEEAGSVFLSKIDLNAQDAINEGYTPFEEVDPLFIPGSKPVNEGIILSSYKQLLK